MKMLVKVLPLSLLFCGYSSLSQSAEISPFIVNGSYTSVTTYPSFVSLFIDMRKYNNTYSAGSYCGGTLLDQQHVLTAAHCVDDIENQLFTAVVPKLQFESSFPYTAEGVMVSEIYYKSSYDEDQLIDDIAILKLTKKIPTVSSADYVQLPDTGDSARYRNTAEAFYAVGHGDTQPDFDNQSYLASTQLEYVSAAICGQEYKRNPNDNLCMGSSTVGTNNLDNAVCQGDSGGPLYWYNGGQYKQVGITSFGPGEQLSSVGCGDPKVIANSVFTEVLDHKSWIESVVAGSETPKVKATESARTAYLNGEVSVTTSSNSGSSGGGSFGVVSLFLIMSGFLRRGRNVA
ncbi:S1 family peptidase [Vibrio ostreicida]|uniref:S1 family peptidase n=1 Tax=Vibrio ostreicida TaxID=526588 RepID=UPI000970A2D9|nr:serine protease [Vibrio ostreicida]